MIVEWFLDLAFSIVSWVLDLIPDDLLPGFVKSPPSDLADIAAKVEGLGVWVPWAVVIGAAGASLGVWAITFVIKVIRQVIAHVPQFGGSG